MYSSSKLYCTPDIKVSIIVKDNPLMLLVLENFGVADFEKEITISQFCNQINVNENVFVLICNLHNGYYIDNANVISSADLPDIISYLKRGHEYYQKEKYPEILNLIREIKKVENLNILSVIETYFDEYFEEVKEHIEYEEKTAFPYFLNLLETEKGQITNDYSSKDYKEHHTDIESSLNAFRDLFILHVHLKDQHMVKRKLLMSLAELEFELKIHSFIEDMILIPLTKRLEHVDSND